MEVAPRAGLADAICDLVSTGATLEANGLREVEVIYRSKACLIQRDGEMADAKQQLIDRLLTRIQGVIQARESKYIMMHAPTERLEEVVALLPGAGGRLFCRWQATSSAWRCTWSAAKPCSGRPWKN